MASIYRVALVHVATLRYLAGALVALAVIVQTLGLTGCGSRPSTRVNLPEPTERSVVGPGDIFVMEIVGEQDLPKEYQIASDGTVDLPYLPALRVEGLDPQQIARQVRKQLIDRGILSNPSVIIQVKEYHSRRITLLGQVSKPGTFPYTPGLTLVQAISVAGGLTPVADSDRVNLTRKTATGPRTVVLSLDNMMEGTAPDIQLQPGDRIFVHDRLF